jgi:septum site-determining protein MinD
MATEDILSLLSVSLLGLVPEDEHIIVSTNRGVPAVHDPRSPAGEAFRRIAARLNGQEVPFMDLDAKDGMFTWVKRLMGFQGRVGANV